MKRARNGKIQSLILLFIANLAGMSLWYMTAAVLPDMALSSGLAEQDLALLSSIVPAGFAVGAFLLAMTGLPDRIDPRGIFVTCALTAATSNLLLIWVPIGGAAAVALRFVGGAAMAGVWPITMKIAVGWSIRHRGLIVSVMVAGLVAGNAAPYLLAWVGGANWTQAIVAGSILTATGGLCILATGLGPHHRQAPEFQMRAIALAWTDRHIRSAILGYLGHMWEFIAFWSWAGAISAASYAHHIARPEAILLGKLTAFLCILVAAPACVLAGIYADRIGKARIAALALIISGSSAVLTALTFGGPVWITFVLILIWGAAVVPDSPQFSALVADHAPPELAGSLLTFQASLGFLLTVLTVQITPIIAEAFGWPVLMALLALGPAFGLWTMRPVMRSDRMRMDSAAHP